MHVGLHLAFDVFVARVVTPDGTVADEEALGRREAVKALVGLGLFGHLVGIPGHVEAAEVGDVLTKGDKIILIFTGEVLQYYKTQ